MEIEDSLDIFGADPFGRDIMYGLSTGRDSQGLAPYGLRYAESVNQPITAKGKGYLGNVGTMQEPITELSASSDFDGRTVRYPLVVPTLTIEELNLLRSGGEPTQEIYSKAQQYALGRLARGEDPFATPQDLRYPQPQAVDTRPYDQIQATPRSFISGLFNSGKAEDKKSESSVSYNLLDYLIKKLNPNLFPTAAKTLFETLQGNKEQITEKNFTKEELTALKDLIDITQNKGHVQYADYIDLMKKQQKELRKIPFSITPSILSVLDPIGNIQNTLGRFRYYRDSQGNLIVVDNYDFNKQRSSSDFLLGTLRNYAQDKIPPGSGRGVKINLGNIDNLSNQPIQYKDPFADTTR